MERLMDEVLAVGRRAGRRAASICRQVLAEAPAAPEAMAKLGKEPVTVADYGSQAVILEEVAQAFPDHGVISEEGAAHLRQESSAGLRDQLVRLVGGVADRSVEFDRICSWIDHEGVPGADFMWAVDPIDGTKGFLRRQQFAVAIGVLHEGRPWAGVLVAPNLPWDEARPEAGRGVMFVGGRGRGVVREALDNDLSESVTVSPEADPAAIRVLGSVESAHGDPRLLTGLMDDLQLGGGVVRVDSQVKYAKVAVGDAEIYLRPQSQPDYREKIWDHVAGVVVTEAAGGRVTDVRGRELDFNRGRKLVDNRGVLATNGLVHERVLESLERLGA